MRFALPLAVVRCEAFILRVVQPLRRPALTRSDSYGQFQIVSDSKRQRSPESPPTPGHYPPLRGGRMQS